MRTIYLLQLLILTAFLGSCHQLSDMNIQQIQRLVLPCIPSASGIEVCPDGIYVAGDDSPFLYRLGKDFQIIEKIRIDEARAAPESGRILSLSSRTLRQ